MFTPPSIRTGGFAALAARTARALFAGISAWNRRRRGRMAAQQLLGWNDHMLNDIGLNRADVRCALRDHRKREASTRLRVLAVERRALALRDAREKLAHAASREVGPASGQPHVSDDVTPLDLSDGASENPDNMQSAPHIGELRMDKRAA